MTLDSIAAILKFRCNCGEFHALGGLYFFGLFTPLLSILSPYSFFFPFAFSLVLFHFLVVLPFLLVVLPMSYHKFLASDRKTVINEQL